MPLHDRQIVFMFSGQGSQYFHMGKELYAHDEIFRQRMQALDARIRELWGLQVLDELYAPRRTPGERLTDTLCSSLGIFMVERALNDLLTARGCQPARLVSSSLGVYAAAVASGMADEDCMLQLLYRQSDTLERTCPPGTLLAVLAPTELYDRSAELKQHCDRISVNGDAHFILAVTDNELATVTRLLKEQQASFVALPVVRPYHSHWVEPAREPLLAVYEQAPLDPGRIPLHTCSTTTEPLAQLSPQTLWEIVRGPIHFRETILRLEQDGPHRYIDLGPSGTLATLLKYILPAHSQSRVHSLVTPMRDSLRDLRELFDALAH